MKPAVALVNPETPGNVGVVARAMKNYGFSELLLVDPPELEVGGMASGFAAGAVDVLQNARVMGFEDISEEFHTVGFTAIPAENESNHTRYPVSRPDELRGDLCGDEALVFGRESTGLSNDELIQLDRVAALPANPRYPVLNLGQAVTVALHELRDLALEDTQIPERSYAGSRDIEGFHSLFAEFLDEINHQEETRHKTQRLVRRVIGRARPTEQEIQVLEGVFRQSLYVLRGQSPDKGPKAKNR